MKLTKRGYQMLFCIICITPTIIVLSCCSTSRYVIGYYFMFVGITMFSSKLCYVLFIVSLWFSLGYHCQLLAVVLERAPTFTAVYALLGGITRHLSVHHPGARHYDTRQLPYEQDLQQLPRIRSAIFLFLCQSGGISERQSRWW